MSKLDVVKLWAAVNQTLVEGAINRPLWEAARTAVALALDEEADCLVLGMPTNRMELRGHIETRGKHLAGRAGKFDPFCVGHGFLPALKIWDTDVSEEPRRR